MRCRWFYCFAFNKLRRAFSIFLQPFSAMLTFNRLILNFLSTIWTFFHANCSSTSSGFLLNTYKLDKPLISGLEPFEVEEKSRAASSRQPGYLIKPRLCGNLGHHSLHGFSDLLAPEKSPKVSVLEADSLQRWHDSIIFLEFVSPPAGQRDFFKNIGIPAPLIPGTSPDNIFP